MAANKFENSRQAGLEYLLKSQHHGWWPYFAVQGPSTEATSWCGIALGRPGANAVVEYLIGQQNSDGGWSTEPGAGPSDWTSALSLLALKLLSGKLTDQAGSAKLGKAVRSAFDRGADFLLSERADKYTPIGRVIMFMLQGPSFDHYSRGWPWNPGGAGWVEPTSYSLMALKQSPAATRKDIQESLSLASDFLAARACTPGGWNHGNNLTLSKHLPPYPITTAQALLALQDRVRHPAVQSGLSYLRQLTVEPDAAMSLSWLIMARDAFGVEIDRECQLLLKHQRPDGSFGESYLLTGLALCALATHAGENPLKLASKASFIPPVPESTP